MYIIVLKNIEWSKLPDLVITEKTFSVPKPLYKKALMVQKILNWALKEVEKETGGAVRRFDYDIKPTDIRNHSCN